MRYTRAKIAGFGYELPPIVVDTGEIEERLTPMYSALGIPPGQIEPLTGVRQRRIWEEGFPMWRGAAIAGRRALAQAGIDAARVGMLVYGAVCRDNLEPATACAVAHDLGVPSTTEVFDLSNACLGVINGIIQIANAIEVGAIECGLVVSCESSRQIVNMTIERMVAHPTMDVFRSSLATMTGGSGSVGVVVASGDVAPKGHSLKAAVSRSAPRFHELCRWGPDTGIPATLPMLMETDAPAVLQNGVALGLETWKAFLADTGWAPDDVDRIICHQVGSSHQGAILQTIGIPAEKDFVTYPFLGNIGTVSLPITAAIASERGFLEQGHRVGMLGIGSGLNCLMLGVEW